MITIITRKKWQRLVDENKRLRDEVTAHGEALKELRKNGNRVWHGVLQGKLLADVLEADFMPVMQEAQ